MIAVDHSDNNEPDFLDEFHSEFNDAYSEIECQLIDLEATPEDKILIGSLLKSVNHIITRLRMLGINEIAELITTIENLLNDIQEEKLFYDSRLSDVILLSISFAKKMIDDVFSGHEIKEDYVKIETALNHIGMSEPENYRQAIREAITLLDPHEGTTLIDTIIAPGIPRQPVHHEQQNEDLAFFKDLMLRLENKHAFWEGRGHRISQLACVMAELSQTRLDLVQLQAAVYLHDIGMAFYPEPLLKKESQLSEDELNQIKQHPIIAYHWLRRIDHWIPAAQMIQQHHECYDGTGYPAGLKHEAICDGAQILAITETFDALTQERVQRNHKRPLLRAIVEINNCSNSQFNPRWVNVFNQAIRKVSAFRYENENKH